MKWLGLTGGVATGKSTVSNLLRGVGIPVIDADQLARTAVLPGSDGLLAIRREFGDGVLAADGTLDRKALGKIIFSDSEQRLKLESILHPIIQELRAAERRGLEQLGMELAFYDVPLLFEKNLDDEFDATVLVYCKREHQIERMKLRNNWSDEEIRMRLDAQIPIEDKMKRSDYVIMNTGSIADLRNNLFSVLESLKSLKI